MPAARNWPGSDVQSWCLTRQFSFKFQIWVVSGRRPVMKEARDGLHRACWAYARSNVTPRAAIRSIAGVKMSWVVV